MDKILNEMMPDWLYDLVKKSIPLDPDRHKKIGNKKYTSGQKIEIGDIILTGLLVESIDSEENDIPNINLKIILFHPNEIGKFYERDEKYSRFMPHSKIPYLKLIDKKDKM